MLDVLDLVQPELRLRNNENIASFRVLVNQDRPSFGLFRLNLF